MKKILIVVDYQNDFVNGALGFEKALALEPVIAAKIAQCRQEGGQVIFTFDTHKENYLETQEGRLLPIVHTVENTKGWELYGKIGKMKKETDKCFKKPGFGSGELYEYLKTQSCSEIELCGVISNICVISNAILAKTAQPEAQIIIDSKAVASNDEELNQKALDVMKSLQMKIL